MKGGRYALQNWPGDNTVTSDCQREGFIGDISKAKHAIGLKLGGRLALG